MQTIEAKFTALKAGTEAMAQTTPAQRSDRLERLAERAEPLGGGEVRAPAEPGGPVGIEDAAEHLEGVGPGIVPARLGGVVEAGCLHVDVGDDG